MKRIAFDDLTAAPWKNGGGVTRELYSYPAAASFDTFLWRASIADVAQSGAFSDFSGVDRVILLLEGEGMHLLAGHGRQITLTTPLQPHRLRGEEQIMARLIDGPCRDFNLMLRRGAASGEIVVMHGDCMLPPGWELLFCVHGSWGVYNEHRHQAQVLLTPRQTLIRENEAGVARLRALSADSVAICVAIELNPPSGYRHAAAPDEADA